MRFYTDPEIEIVKFDVGDIVTVSGLNNVGDGSEGDASDGGSTWADPINLTEQP